MNSGGTSNKCYEVWYYYGFDFDIYQELRDMPAGVYELQVQGFYRYMSGNDAWQHYLAQDIEYVKPGGAPVSFYINECSEPFINIFADEKQITNSSFYSSSCSKFTKDGTTYYFPNNMSDASIAFSNGMYKKSVYCNVENGTLRLGIKGVGMEWACWDNVRLIYYGMNDDFTSIMLNRLIAELEELVAELHPYLEKLKGNEGYDSLFEALAAAQQAIDQQDMDAMREAIDKLKSGMEGWKEEAETGYVTIVLKNAGTLQEEIIDQELDDIHNLILKGPINGEDIIYLRSASGRLANLERLDIRDITLVDSEDIYSQYTFVIGTNVVGAASYYRHQFVISSNERVDTLPKSLSSWGDGIYTYRHYCRDLGGAFNGMNLKKVVWPSSVNSIGVAAFAECANLETVILPEGITSVGEMAFYKCGKMGSLSDLGNVTSVGTMAFKNCSTLKSVGDLSHVTTLEPSAFLGCSSLTGSIRLVGVDDIPEYAFYGCALSDITFSDNLRTIGDKAFSSCDFPSVTFGDKLQTIGVEAFASCHNLNSVTFPKVMDDIEIGERAFSDTPWFDNLPAEDGVVYIGPSAITTKGTPTSISFKEGTKKVAEKFVDENTKNVLTSVILPSSMKSIGDEAFYNCKQLASLSMAKGVEKIGNRAFAGCAFKTLVLPEGLKKMGTDVFSGNDKLMNLTIHSLTEVVQDGAEWSGERAFYHCPALGKVTIGPKVRSIPLECFANCSDLLRVTFEQRTDADRLYIGRSAFNSCKTLKYIDLPEQTDSIGSNAFYNCSKLTTMVIPANVTSIREKTFYGCSSLASVTFPDGLTNIGNNAFSDCSSLTSLTFPASLTNIGNNAFSDCSSLTSLTFPASLTTFGHLPFNGCFCIKEIISLMRDPASCRLIDFYQLFATKLYVPTGTKWKYERRWEEFFNYIEIPSGDVNFDGAIDMADVSSVISSMAGEGDVLARGLSDINGDGATDVADIVTIISIMAKGTSVDEEPETEPDRTPDGVVAIDMGLPSGTKWANMNIGATSSNDTGLFFAWGDDNGEASDNVFNWANYKWMNESGTSWEHINKYQIADDETSACWYDDEGNFIGDNKTMLELTDDVAHICWGGKWAMPTLSEIRELLYYSTYFSDGRITSVINGNTIIIPSSSSRIFKLPYWAATLGNNTSSADSFYFTFERRTVGLSFETLYEILYTDCPRNKPCVIRPVIRK